MASFKPEPARKKPASGSEPVAQNTTGIVIPKTSPNAPGAPTNPPVKAETPQEKSLLEKAGELLDKGEIPVLNQAKEALKGGATSLLGTGIVGQIGAGAIEVLFPTNVIDIIPGGKIVSGGKKAAKLGETALKGVGKEGAGKAARESAEKGSKKAEGSTGAYSRGGKGPCDHLKKGNPEGLGPYRGGSYGGTTKSGIESHHSPANSVSPLPKSQGPAVQMEIPDHGETMSHGHQGADGAAFRRKIGELLALGRWRDAMAEEIKDIRRVARESGDPRKYNEGIREMLAYFKCLEKNGALPK